jgi:phosphatidylglycerophosphate synthase
VLPVVLAADAGELETAWSSLAGMDEARVRVRRAQRSDDGFLSTFLVRPLSQQLTPSAVRRGLAASSVTAVALLLGLLAAGAYALASTGLPVMWRVLGSVLLLGSLVVDCVDGEVARSTRTASARGGWLDVGADRVKEYAVYAGLAAGAHGRVVWWLALAAMALLVVRHTVDFGFAAITQPGGGGAVAAWSERTSSRPAAMWAKRAVIMPVGERTILLIVLAPLAGVRVTLVALLVLGVVAAAWTTAGRVGRTLLGPGEGSLWSRAAWLRPAVERVLEQGLVAAVVAALAPEAVPAAYAWLAVVAFGHYDLVYRQRLAGVFTTGGLLGPLPFPWPVRVLVVLVVLLVAGDRAGGVLVVLTALLALALVRSSIRFWSRWVPSTP